MACGWLKVNEHAGHRENAASGKTCEFNAHGAKPG
jgi:hypothetical protein